MSNKHQLVKAIVGQAGSNMFKVTFVKRTNGEVREMLARTGVKKGVTGVGFSFDPDDRGLIPVYDMEKAAEIASKWRSENPDAEEPADPPEKAFRFISSDEVLHMKVNGQIIHFVDDPAK